MMGIGKPVVFTAGLEIQRIPENACLRIDCGPAEEEHRRGLLRWAGGHPGALKEIGRRAAAHIAREHEPSRIAQRFWDVIG